MLPTNFKPSFDIWRVHRELSDSSVPTYSPPTYEFEICVQALLVGKIPHVTRPANIVVIVVEGGVNRIDTAAVMFPAYWQLERGRPRGSRTHGAARPTPGLRLRLRLKTLRCVFTNVDGATDPAVLPRGRLACGVRKAAYCQRARARLADYPLASRRILEDLQREQSMPGVHRLWAISVDGHVPRTLSKELRLIDVVLLDKVAVQTADEVHIQRRVPRMLLPKRARAPLIVRKVL